MSIHVYTAEQLRPRIIRAIKNGNHETKYIEEACKAEYSSTPFHEALRQLEKEGVIKYNDLLEGYYLERPDFSYIKPISKELSERIRRECKIDSSLLPYRAKFLTLGNAQTRLALLSLNRNFHFGKAEE